MHFLTCSLEISHIGKSIVIMNVETKFLKKPTDYEND